MDIKKRKFILIFLLSVLLSFLVLEIVQANSPDNPAPLSHANINLCVEPPHPDLSNPSQPIFRWDTWGNPQDHYWLLVDDSPPVHEPAVYRHEYRFIGNVSGRISPHCGCDTTRFRDCPNIFSATIHDPAVCYDWWRPWGGVWRSAMFRKHTILVSRARTYLPSPIVNTGPIWSGNNFHQLSMCQLATDQTYWWCVANRDTSGSWTGWTGCRSFIIPNHPPSATNLQVRQPDYCLTGPSGIFSWTFTDPCDTQSAYQIQVDNNSDFSSPEVESGKIISSSNSFATPSGILQYNTTYHWRLMVWDTRDLSSVWIFGPSFTTPKHRHPSADFSWTPERPMVNELVQFTDKSVAYGGATIVRWDWTFQDGNPATSSLQNPATRFTSTGPKQVTLAVTDSSGFTCSVQKIIRAQRPLEWIEIPPFIWLRNFFVSAEGFFQKVF